MHPLYSAFHIPIDLNFFKINHWGKSKKKSAIRTISLSMDRDYVTQTYASDLTTHSCSYTYHSYFTDRDAVLVTRQSLTCLLPSQYVTLKTYFFTETIFLAGPKRLLKE